MITIVNTIERRKHINLKPANNRKQLKKLFSILSPNIIYEKNYELCLTFIIIYNIIFNEKRKADVFISPD